MININEVKKALIQDMRATYEKDGFLFQNTYSTDEKHYSENKTDIQVKSGSLTFRNFDYNDGFDRFMFTEQSGEPDKLVCAGETLFKLKGLMYSGDVGEENRLSRIVWWLYLNDMAFNSKKEWRSAFIEMLKKELEDK